MKNLRRALLFLSLVPFSAAVVALAAPPVAPASASGIEWRPWSDDLFVQAKKEKKLVVLDLVAVWCHWCHVMDEKTYGSPDVARIIGEKFIPVRVDQDARPDISARYEDWGWPATIVFAPDGKELVKRSGYIPADRMLSLLQAVVDDPTPGPSVRPEPKLGAAAAGALAPALRKELEAAYLETYDSERGSWGFVQKFLEPASVEFALLRARGGDKRAEAMARQTLAAQSNLIDPVWGGVYQYSTGGDWKEPHFEKLALFQASNLRVYALAYAEFHDAGYLNAARDIRRYLDAFLKSPEGAFYVSQDADAVPGEHGGEYFALGDAGRRARGVPRVDTHVYARENGRIIDALVALWRATEERDVLEEALSAARWVVANRALAGGGFRHDAIDAGGPYLGDTAAMGMAFVSLYEATSDRVWLDRASAAADFIAKRFALPKGAGAGYAALATTSKVTNVPRRPNRDENVLVVRFASTLYRATGAPAHLALARTAMRFLAARPVATERPVGPILLADIELGSR
jgi:uncharacterized protein